MAIALRALPDISEIIIHCADTPNGQAAYTITDIDAWHRERGFDRVGYHHVIHIDGTVHMGRSILMVGAHCRAGGRNQVSIGVCLIGRDAFTKVQWQALKKLVTDTRAALPHITRVSGHRDWEPHKTCPNFSVDEWVMRAMVPEVVNVCAPA